LFRIDVIKNIKWICKEKGFTAGYCGFDLGNNDMATRLTTETL
jgi:hypothetical protein